MSYYYRFTILITFVAVLLTSCGASSSNKSETNLSKIIGTDDREPVKAEDKGDGYYVAQAIGAMLQGCTVTHLGGRIGATAGHCVESLECKDKYAVIWSFTEDRTTGSFVSYCEEVIATKNDPETGEDYAFILYDQAPAYYFGSDPNNKPTSGVPVILYSHPSTRPLETSGWCQLVEMDEKKANFHHTCDTQQGSSGAAVLDDSFRVIGIHHSASRIHKYNIGTYLAETPFRHFLIDYDE